MTRIATVAERLSDSWRLVTVSAVLLLAAALALGLHLHQAATTTQLSIGGNSIDVISTTCGAAADPRAAQVNVVAPDFLRDWPNTTILIGSDGTVEWALGTSYSLGGSGTYSKDANGGKINAFPYSDTGSGLTGYTLKGVVRCGG